MDWSLLLLQMMGIFIWLIVMTAALVLVSTFRLFFLIFQYYSWLTMDIPHSMTPGHRPWKKSILTGDALYAAWWACSPFTWNNSISMGLNLFILIGITPPGLNVTNAIHPFIYSVEPGNQFMLSDPNIFFVLFFVVDSFRSPCCLCFSYSPLPHVTCLSDTPSLPHVACVLFMYPNHLILRWIINESVQIWKKRRRRSHLSDTALRKRRKIEGIWPMPING